MSLTFFSVVGCAEHSQIKRQNVHWFHWCSVPDSSPVAKRHWKLPTRNSSFKRPKYGSKRMSLPKEGCLLRGRGSQKTHIIIASRRALRGSRHSVCPKKLEWKETGADPLVDESHHLQDPSSKIKGGRLTINKISRGPEEKVTICAISEESNITNPMKAEEQAIQCI